MKTKIILLYVFLIFLLYGCNNTVMFSDNDFLIVNKKELNNGNIYPTKQYKMKRATSIEDIENHKKECNSNMFMMYVGKTEDKTIEIKTQDQIQHTHLNWD